MKEKKGLIFVVDDDEDIRLALVMLLSSQGYQVIEAEDEAALTIALGRMTPDLVLLDMNFSRDTTSGAEGLEILKKLVYQQISTVLMTAWGSIELAVQGMQLGAKDFIEKPWKKSRLLELVETHSKKQSVKPSLQPVKRSDPEWIAQSSAMASLEQMLEQIAPTDANVLILGENGTGKSALAMRIHTLSRRSSDRFVSLNMAAVPENLFESELFGHKKGAFTDAREDRQGRFELAQQGSIFLDEIGTLPSGVQPKLLRVLETGEYEAVGSSYTQIADVRVISATNANLDALVKQGAFRQDLLFRLNTFVIEIPPLRSRKEDIDALCQMFIRQFSEKYNRNVTSLSADVRQTLSNYSWPGNVRELSHVIERAVLLCREEQVTMDNILLPNDDAREYPADMQLRHLEDIELEMIELALEQHNRHISNAAEALGISRNALYRRMEKYGIDK